MIRIRLKTQRISFFFFIVALIFLPASIISAQELFWENPELLVENNVWFPLTAFNGESSIIMWQEFDESDNGSVEMSISLMTAIDGKNWIKRNKVLGPFSFTGDKVSVSSLAVDSSGSIYIAISSSTEGILIYASRDNGESFELIGKPGGKETTTVSPKLFLTESGSFILFVTQSVIEDRSAFNQESTLSITYSVSSNGRSWSDYVPMVSGSNLSNVYLPFHVSDRSIEHVVFQASPEESRFYQLYHISSQDRGRTWSTPVLITDISENGNRSRACRLMKRAEILTEIYRLEAEIATPKIMTLHERKVRLTEIIRADITDYFEVINGRIQMKVNTDKVQANGLSVKKASDKTNKSYNINRATYIYFSNKIKAIKELNKMDGVYRKDYKIPKLI